jgi:hypothetical protein
MAITEEQLKEAARKAYAAGDAAGAKRLIDAARAAAAPAPAPAAPAPVTEEPAQVAGAPAPAVGAPQETQDAPSFWEKAYENVIGSGAIDTPGERFGSVVKAGGAGLMRGAAELVGLPGTAGDLLNTGAVRAANALLGTDLQTTQEATGRPSPISGQAMRSGLSAVTGGASEYRDPTIAGKLAGTTGEMIGGGAGLKIGSMAAAGSEALGALTEGSAAEPYARMVGAFFTPVLMPKLAQSVKSAFSSAASRPSVETLRDAKNAAYDAVDSAGIKIPASSMDDLANSSVDAARRNNYVPEVDNQTKAALSIFDNKRGQELTIGELDRIRQGLWARLKTAPNENALREMIDGIDEVIQKIPLGGELMDAARLANSRYKKSELLDDAFKKAELQTASTGSGGNIVNKFRQAVTSIVTNKDKAKFFSEQELGFMRAFVKGSNAQNALRLVGKVSPSGNGLMQVLNIGAIAYNPYMAGITLLGAGAKAISERSALKGASTLQDIIASGQIPAARQSAIPRVATRVTPGVMAGEQAAPQ